MPYAAVVEHHVSVATDLTDLTSETIESLLTERITNANVPYSVLISGTFKSIEISSKPPRNTAPYLDILAKQPHFTKENISGTIVGIWSPKHLESLYGNGFHLHFISDDRTFGAHLVHFVGDKLHVEFGQVGQIEQEFAEDNASFNKLSFD